MQMWREKKELPPIYVSKRTAADLMCYMCAIKSWTLPKVIKLCGCVNDYMANDYIQLSKQLTLRHKSIQIDSIITDQENTRYQSDLFCLGNACHSMSSPLLYSTAASLHLLEPECMINFSVWGRISACFLAGSMVGQGASLSLIIQVMTEIITVWSLRADRYSLYSSSCNW